MGFHVFAAFRTSQRMFSFSERNSDNGLAVRTFNVAMSFSVLEFAVLKLEPVCNPAEKGRYLTHKRCGTFAEVEKNFIFLCTLRYIF